MRASFLFLAAASILHAQAADTAALGQRLFESQCALCHGQTGTGGRGPALNRPKLTRAPDGQALEKLISNGIPPEMPGAWQLSPREVTSVAAYVRSLGSIPPESLPGDPSRGAAVYRAQSCAACHMIDGAGSGFGPELSSIGARRNAAHLREALLKPGAFVPDDYVTVEATTAPGDVIRGIRANEDTFTIQIRRMDGSFVSFRKADLRALNKPSGQSLMPSYEGKLSPAERDDLVAFLAGLKGKP